MLNYLKSLSTNQKFFAIATAAHLAILFLMFFEFSSPAVPILSFSVTMNDQVSARQNNISATTIASSKESVKRKEKVEETDNKNSDKIIKKQKEENSQEKSKGENVSNSKQQNAVISKDAPAIFDASYLNNPSPSYPPASRKAGEQGLVLLNVFVNTAGGVDKIEIGKTSGHSRLDIAALKTVKNWRFVPAKKGGQVEASWVQVPINFVLETAK